MHFPQISEGEQNPGVSYKVFTWDSLEDGEESHRASHIKTNSWEVDVKIGQGVPSSVES